MGEKIRVLFFIPSLAGGGAERVMASLLGGIDRTRINPCLLLLYPLAGSPYNGYLPDDMRVSLVRRRSDSFFGKAVQFMNFLGAIRRERPDVLVSSLTHSNIMALLAGTLFGIKVIVCEHINVGELIRTREGKYMLGLPVARLVKVLYRYAYKVIVVSEGIGANAIEEFNIPERKIRVIHNPINSERISEMSGTPASHPFFNDGVPVITAVGRLVDQKGFDVLMEAFQLVVSRIDARLIILGEGPEREKLQKLMGDYGLDGKVSLAGFQGNPFNFVARSDVFVLSSRYEGLPMALLEAMACGVPVIAADCRSGPAEILDGGRCGRLVPVGDVKAFAAAIAELLRDENLRTKFSRVGMERTKDFSADKIIIQYEQVICESMRSGG